MAKPREQRDAGATPNGRSDEMHHHLTPREAAAMDLRPDEVAEEDLLEEEVPRQVAIGKKFGSWRTIASFGVAALILVFAVWKSGIDWGKTFTAIKHANLLLFALAFVAYYGSFPIRTNRWRRLLHNANHGPLQAKIDSYPTWDLTQILYLSWFANVVVPAKLGDIYRAYLARRWLGVSLSRTVGTVLAERIMDLLVLFPLLVIAAFLTFQSQLLKVPNIGYALTFGLVLAVAAVVFLGIVWRAGDSVLRVLPHRLHDVYTHFRHGAIGSFKGDAPLLFGETVVIWLLEGARLTCILGALGLLSAGRIGPSTAIFLALGSSVLTTLPLTPGGLGVVEPFIAGVLTYLLTSHNGSPTAVATSAAAAVAVLDRIISYLSIVVIGGFVYALSDKARFSAPPQPDNTPPGSGPSPVQTGSPSTPAGAAVKVG